ncbi:MAG: tRNA (uridine(34)/cytosine(34)/5-carboxymethylaminomethyluridine(34)-2'-O)-methyltransferase TrmL [Acidobacteriota bacterium]|nr:tRNA (uridine(34)/cytosine(34)/5-carboxymethylaminomethyluridine(34)-2'-O)-methyltransferase TrmL [Blastocatellia bacterium]MDW8413303.1 tRNA (uridine(34)/cytosine(34)/5-carboxymethylaminomethyluridine(34)-2'-O)-methyltransferase TrmL [Acidobacteriota bacterium]
MINIVLVEPEIHPNTGNIARLCAATGAALHLVEPLGFRIDAASIKRAGLDYWPYVKLHRYPSLRDFMQCHGERRLWYFTTKASISYTTVEYQIGDYLLFGSETSGLPKELLEASPQRCLRIPMSNRYVRSLNLANCAAIALYEALRQLGYSDDSCSSSS